jgi:hypothetical protein
LRLSIGFITIILSKRRFVLHFRDVSCRKAFKNVSGLKNLARLIGIDKSCPDSAFSFHVEMEVEF